MSLTRAPFEPKDTRFGAIVALLGLLFILIGGTVLVTRLFNRWLNRDVASRNPIGSPMAQTRALPPEPRLQVNPTVDLIRLRDIENVTLNQYAWIDGTSDRLRIPIERAMAIVAERGLPSRPARGDASK